MFEPKIKLTRELFEKCRQAAAKSGCASPEEWVLQILESEADKALASTSKTTELSAAEVQDIADKLKGLGYLE